MPLALSVMLSSASIAHHRVGRSQQRVCNTSLICASPDMMCSSRRTHWRNPCRSDKSSCLCVCCAQFDADLQAAQFDRQFDLSTAWPAFRPRTVLSSPSGQAYPRRTSTCRDAAPISHSAMTDFAVDAKCSFMHPHYHLSRGLAGHFITVQIAQLVQLIVTALSPNVRAAAVAHVDRHWLDRVEHEEPARPA